MPVLSIETNQAIAPERLPELLRTISRTTAQQLGKSEDYVMVQFSNNPNMLFAGTDEPLAFLQLKSIGLPESATWGLSATLCEVMETEFGIPKRRVYIEFTDAPRKMWGYNGGTF